MYYYKKPFYKKKYSKYYKREYKYHYIQQAKSLRNIQRKRRKAKIQKITNYLKKKYYGSKLHQFFVKRKVKRFILKQNNLKPT